jgi:hypothetical protein
MTTPSLRRTVDLRRSRIHGSEGGDPMNTHTVANTATVDRAGTSTTRVGAGLGLASIVLTMAGLVLVAPAEAVLTSPAEDVVAFYTEGSPGPTYAGGFLEAVGLLLLLPFLVMLAGRLRGPGVSGDLLAPTAVVTGSAYVLLSLAPGQAAGAAALWVGHSGDAEPSILLALNDLRVFSYFIALLCLAAFLICIGAGATATRRLPRWASWSALTIGTALAAGVAVAHTGLHDIVSLLAVAWMVVVSIALLRHPERGNDGS